MNQQFKAIVPSGGKDFHPTALTEPYPDKKSGQAVNLSITPFGREIALLSS
jgi:hypothetical protein